MFVELMKEYRALNNAMRNHQLWEMQDCTEPDPRIQEIFKNANIQVRELLVQDIYETAKTFVTAYETKVLAKENEHIVTAYKETKGC